MIWKRDRKDGLLNRAYKDNRIDDIQYEDPRFGLLRSEM